MLPEDALRLMGVATGVALGIDSVELIATGRQWLHDPLRSPSLGTMPQLTDTLLLRENTLAVALSGVAVLVRFLAAVVLITQVQSLIAVACVGAVVASLGLSIMTPMGTEGSDHMLPVLLLGLGGAAIVNDHAGHEIGLWFVALEACLAYFAAGAAKLFGVPWRRGTAMASIMATGWGGHELVRKALKRWPALSRVGSWGTVGYELMFPIVLFVPAPYAIAILAMGAVFHFGIATTMGLNIFFWAFVATYPAVAACSFGLGVR